ncbi:hypothetical protein HA149_07155 [Prochlorococcus marinus XMU1406]|uniref:hypothetical protein n=1 Tax=Prochlorococcus marinus TaxID=1219 RepID=UPI001AD96037|nr:hypothetical protein [Prochlorococcus marinus]MBO8206834.1 hypothetical protein [Prochlorococcus marinus XMU1406]MCR8542653.1 hypothetical protein [Prochlorococcus marinus XMU1427]
MNLKNKNLSIKLNYLPEVFLMGGLGNQLWIISYAYQLTINYEKVLINESWYKNYSIFFFSRKRVRRNGYCHIFKNLSQNLSFFNSPFSLLKYRFFKSFNSKSFKKKFDYFQDHKNISLDFKKKISKLLISSLSEKQKNKIILQFKSINKMKSIHFRIGDKGLPKESEIKYIKSLLKKINQKDKFLLFSDSQKTAIDFLVRFINNQLIIIDCEDEVYDLIILALCNECIILRESTFSYWARILSNEIRKEINFLSN